MGEETGLNAILNTSPVVGECSLWENGFQVLGEMGPELFVLLAREWGRDWLKRHTEYFNRSRRVQSLGEWAQVFSSFSNNMGGRQAN